jgi:hypothetical protein
LDVISKLQDNRINAVNILVEIKAHEYVDIAKGIIANNEFQRKRVKNAGTIYSLLKSDILSGCLIPPIVLASRSADVPMIGKIDASFISEKIFGNTADLMILDGLQRTHSLIEIFENNENQTLLENYLIRVEIYLNITEVGILYRMLTLNAGQTPMSLRHQIEILYSNFADKKIGELNIIRQIDDTPRSNHHDYNYSDLIEGYNSFLERNEDPIDRYSLLDIVQSIGKISSDHGDDNSFSHFAELHHNFVEHLQKISGNWEYPAQPEEIAPEYRVLGQPFGASPFKIFNRAQALTGFGAAVGSLIDQKIIHNLSEVRNMTSAMSLADVNRDLLLINKCLDEIKQDAKKIGNAQRMFFRYFFRHIFDKTQNEYYLNFAASTDQAKRRTLANM